MVGSNNHLMVASHPWFQVMNTWNCRIDSVRHLAIQVNHRAGRFGSTSSAIRWLARSIRIQGLLKPYPFKTRQNKERCLIFIANWTRKSARETWSSVEDTRPCWHSITKHNLFRREAQTPGNDLSSTMMSAKENIWFSILWSQFHSVK